MCGFYHNILAKIKTVRAIADFKAFKILNFPRLKFSQNFAFNYLIVIKTKYLYKNLHGKSADSSKKFLKEVLYIEIMFKIMYNIYIHVMGSVDLNV